MKTVMHKTVGGRKSKLHWFGGLAAGSLFMLSTAQAQFVTNAWPIYEPFGEYTNGTRVGTDISYAYWTTGNGGSQFWATNAAALAYPALLADTNSSPKGAQEVPTGGNQSGDKGWIFPTNNSTWYTSFLVNYQNNGGQTENRVIFQVATGATISNSFSRIYTGVWLTGDYRIRFTKNFNESNSYPTAKFSDPTPVLSTNVPHLVVMRYVKVPGGNDRVDLWLDPTPFGNPASIPPPTISSTNGVNGTNFNSFFVDHRKPNGAGQNTLSTFQIDEIRLGDTWATVTPLATPAPGPLFAVTGGGTTCPSSPPSIGLSGSATTNDYWLYTNAVYCTTLPGTGSALDFGTQSVPGIYSVLASNTVTGNLGWMSNNVTVAVLQPPNITTQPFPMVVATNNRAEFKAVVTGDALGFQWYRDGIPLTNDAHLTGATTNDLVIWPATTADVGNYYCIISNTCAAFANSTTNSLTLAAPNDLVWTGDGFNVDVWDIVNATLEWNSGSAGFNPGDNVTFNDAYIYANAVTLTGVLTPTRLAVNASRDYGFVGSGIIAGSNALAKDGTGRLSLSNLVTAGVFQANPYTGGTFITNGTVFVQSAGALGTGPINLVGGALETLGKLVFTNDVNVTASSIVQLDQTGNQSITLSGGFNLSPGITLVFTNSATTTNSPNWAVLTSPFTNNASIVLSVRSVATNSTQFLSCNVTTNYIQVYNGVISDVTFPGPVGGGGLIKSGPGAVYLNGANTYTFLTTNAGGLLAGSGSIKSPLAVAAGATLGAGSQTAIGTFIVNSNIALSGNVYVRVDKSLAQSNDLISATGLITNLGTGTVTVTNIGATAIAPGDTFRIFSGAVSNGAALAVTGGDVGWANHLAIDGSIQVVNTLASYPTNISFSVSGGTLSLNWPTTHLGWVLQSQTNSLSRGLGTNWLDVLNTENGTSASIPVNPTNATVFYRLRHP